MNILFVILTFICAILGSFHLLEGRSAEDRMLCIPFYLSALLFLLVAAHFHNPPPAQTEQQYCNEYSDYPLKSVPAKCVKYFMPEGSPK
jgi:predicted membrane channel-forming protein YqfA (hemolysin III family)